MSKPIKTYLLVLIVPHITLILLNAPSPKTSSRMPVHNSVFSQCLMQHQSTLVLTIKKAHKTFQTHPRALGFFEELVFVVLTY